MSLHRKLRALVAAILDEADRNPTFADKLDLVLCENRTAEKAAGKRSGRRTPAILDPFAIMQEKGETSLREALRGWIWSNYGTSWPSMGWIPRSWR